MWPMFLFRRKCHCNTNELVRSLWALTFLLRCPDVHIKVVRNISDLESHKDNGELYVVNLMTVRNFHWKSCVSNYISTINSYEIIDNIWMIHAFLRAINTEEGVMT